MWSPWYIIKDQSKTRGYVVKRYIIGTTRKENLPISQYKDLSLSETESLIRRLNMTHELKRKTQEERYDFDHTFINAHAKERFKLYIESRAENQGHIQTQMRYLDVYVFGFFILKLKLPDPQFWHQHEHDWGKWLSTEQELSASTIKQITFIANRFLRFISTKLYPEKLTVMSLEPLGRNKLKSLKARAPNLKRYKFISEELFETIIKELSGSPILANIELAYRYGLRLSETMALKQSSIYREHLFVNEQAIGYNGITLKLGPTKTLDTRKIPHWFSIPKDTWKLIQEVKPMHSDTLNEKVNRSLDKFQRQSHDLRRSFITRSLRLYNHRDVQMAAGHKDLRTTLAYAQDDRELGGGPMSLDELE
jgi:hypothetical protein